MSRKVNKWAWIDVGHKSVEIMGILWGPPIRGKLILTNPPRGLQVTSGLCMYLIIPYLIAKEFVGIFKDT